MGTYADLQLPAARWFSEPSQRDGRETWHRWGAIPGGHGGIWGWDRWCRVQTQPFGMSGGEDSPPHGARVCRRCRAAEPAWWNRPNMGDVIDAIFGPNP